MKKRTVSYIISLAMALSFLASGCGSTAINTDGDMSAENTEDSAGDKENSSMESDLPAANGQTVIRFVNTKAEIDKGLKILSSKYEEISGVKVVVETLQSGQDSQSVLKGYYNSGNMPDIFMFEGDIQYNSWKNIMVDMSGEKWTYDTESEYIKDGKVYGFPITTEAIGLTYNADILEKAGIDPGSITGPESMAAAFEKLDSMKKELGLKAVIGYYTEAANLWWSAGQHIFGTYLDSGLKRDDTTYIDLLNDGGQLDEERLLAFADMIALFNKYTDKNGVSGTYDEQIAGFAQGQYAFVTQGSWIGAVLMNDDADLYADAGSFEIGMVPYAFIEGQDTIQTNCPSWLVINKNGNVNAAKAFFEWCADNNGGQEILATECGLISPFYSSTYKPVDPFAQTIEDYTTRGKTSAWHWQSWKDGLAQNATCIVFRDFAKGDINSSEDFAYKLQDAVEAYYLK